MLRKRPLVIGLAAFVALSVLGGAGAYAYFFTGLRSAPAPLGLSSLGSGSSPADTSVDGLLGHWTVTTGSQAGYRVKEVLVGQPTKHEAVARTSAVMGELTLARASSGLQVNGLRFVVELSNLQSVDTVAGHNVTNRDRNVSRTLDVQTYPDAVFAAAALQVPVRLAQGQTITVAVPGTFTIHGVARPARANAQVRMAGGAVQAAGTIDIDMTQFGVTPPKIAFAESDPQVTVDFMLILSRS
jgi:polyisoprenoid-binding protein YceI